MTFYDWFEDGDYEENISMFLDTYYIYTGQKV